MKSQSVNDRTAWQRLRKDVRSSVAVLAIVLAGLAALLSLFWALLEYSRATDRSTPLYWVLLLPFAWWAASVASFTPWALRLVRPAAMVFIVLAAVTVWLALLDGSGWLLSLGAAAVAVVGSGVGLLLYPGSLVATTRGGNLED